MKAHFLPKSYLKGFACPDVPEGEERKVWVRRLPNGEWALKGAKDVAYKEDYYAVELPDGRLSQALENKGLQQVETRVAVILRERLDPAVTLTQEEREYLAVYVANMMVRIPSFRRALDKMADGLGKVTIAILKTEHLKDPAKREAYRQELRDSGQADMAEQWTSEFLRKLDPEQFEIEFTRNAHLLYSFAQITEMSCAVADMKWTLMRTQAPDLFVTSDSPFVMEPPGLAMPDVLITLPLTKTVCLRAEHGSDETRWRDVERDEVLWANLRTVKGARTVIAPTQNYPGVE